MRLLQPAALLAICSVAALPAQNPLSPDAGSLAKACNAFAGDLVPALGSDANPTCSPASIAIALTMLQAGARGDTADELAHVLHLPAELRGERLLQAAAELQAAIGKPTRVLPEVEPAQLAIVNDLWAQQGFPLEQDYVTALQSAFHAAPTLLDFRTDPEAARLRINAHIAEATNQRIKDLLNKGYIATSTRFVLTNALWFRAQWLQDFSVGATKDAAFHLDATHAIQVPTMHQTNRFAYAENDRWQALSMPFLGTMIRCEIVLPRDGTAIADAMQTIVAGDYEPKLAPTSVKIALPRFQVAVGHLLAGPLQKLGLRTAFGPTADFTGIANGRTAEERVFVDEVVHRTWIAVDEHGAEAAAATAIVMRAGSARPDEPKEFTADHPFAFALRDMATGLLLFVGRVDDPRAGE